MSSAQEVEIKIRPSSQTKLSLLESQNAGEAVQKIKQLFEFADYDIAATKSTLIRDEYLDTSDFQFLRDGMSCRLRYRGSDISLDFKSPKLKEKAGTDGFFDRTENSLPISIAQRDEILRGSTLPDACKIWFVDQSMPTIKLVCKVSNEREIFEMRHTKSPDERYQLSVDKCIFSDPHTGYVDSREFVEIEIEAESEHAKQNAPQLRKKLGKILDREKLFEFSTESKYEKAVNTLRLKGWLPRRFVAVYGHEIGFAGLLVGVLGIFAGSLPLLWPVSLIFLILIGLVSFVWLTARKRN